MIIGKHDKNDKMIQVDLELHCSNCEKNVPGGIKVSEKYYGTESFEKELELFQENYLCGICRDKKRVNE
jgi:hypothetical protein